MPKSHYRASRLGLRKPSTVPPTPEAVPTASKPKPVIGALAKLAMSSTSQILVAATLVSGLITCIQLLFASGGSTNILNALARTVDVGTILYTILLPLGPLIGAVAGFIYFTNVWYIKAYDRSKAIHQFPAAYIIPWLFCLLFTSLLNTALMFLGYWGMIAFVKIKDKLTKRKSKTRYIRTVNASTGGVSIESTVILLYVVFLATFNILFPNTNWLIKEQIKTNYGSTYYGYILETDVRWTTLLTTDRDLVIESTSQIESRHVCQPSVHFTLRPLLSVRSEINELDCEQAQGSD